MTGSPCILADALSQRKQKGLAGRVSGRPDDIDLLYLAFYTVPTATPEVVHILSPRPERSPFARRRAG
jgi:hypothetical protein